MENNPHPYAPYTYTVSEKTIAKLKAAKIADRVKWAKYDADLAVKIALKKAKKGVRNV